MCRKEIDFTTCDLCRIINWLVPVGVFWDWIFVLIVEGSRWEEKVVRFWCNKQAAGAACQTDREMRSLGAVFRRGR